MHNVLLCVTGSLAAVESVKLARELKRRGFNVKVVASKSSLEIVGVKALAFAAEFCEFNHVELAGINGWCDVLLIAPATANTIAKVANGVSDSEVSLIALTALGSNKRVIVAPAMHLGMFKSPALQKNLKTIESYGVEVVYPKIEENKAKLASIEEICLYVERAVSSNEFSGKKVVVTAGPTYEFIDPIRFISNRSSGKMGLELALEFWRRKAEVKLITSKPSGLRLKGFEEVKVVSVGDMLKACLSEVKNCDLFVSAAAPSDFVVEKAESKIKTCEELTLKLKAAPKIIHEVRKSYSGHIIGFKAETGLSDRELESVAVEKMLADKLEMVVANDVAERGMGTEDTRVLVVTKNRREWFEGDKRSVAKKIVDVYVSEFAGCEKLAKNNKG